MSRQKYFIDIGKKYGKLLVIENVGIIKRYTNYKCMCDCGNEKIIKGSSLFGKTPTKSCGCLLGQNLIPFNKIKKRKHGMSHTSFYSIYHGIKQRCTDKNLKEYKWYGGRGITYDPRWEDFLEFKKDMYFKYLYAVKQLKIKKPSIERININGNYCKENCCWIPLKEQASNTRRLKWFKAVSPDGKKYKHNHQTNFAKEHNLQQSLIHKCLHGKREHHKGWCFEYI